MRSIEGLAGRGGGAKGAAVAEDAQRFDTSQSLEGWASHGDLPERILRREQHMQRPLRRLGRTWSCARENHER